MRHGQVSCIALVLLCVGTATAADSNAATNEQSFAPTKDARITFHPSEADFNGGASPRLRTSNVKQNAGEAVLMAFDTTAIGAFLDKHKDKKVTARLILVSRGLHHGSNASVEVAALDTASDWNEGTKSQTQAENGEVTFTAAQYKAKPWTTVAGKEVANLRDLFFDTTADTTKTLLNKTKLKVSTSDDEKPVAIELDSEFIEHLAKDTSCKGIIIFNRDRTMLADFYSREHDQLGPKLVLSVGDSESTSKKKDQ